jgi:hypothetical protein
MDYLQTDERYNSLPLFVYEELNNEVPKKLINNKVKLCLERIQYMQQYHVIESYPLQIIISKDAHKVC